MRRGDGMDCQAVVAAETGCPEEKLQQEQNELTIATTLARITIWRIAPLEDLIKRL
jgi:hypothetical protein